MISEPHSIMLDAHALSCLATRTPAMLAWGAAARRTGSEMYVSTATLAETTDGSTRDAAVRRIVNGINRENVTESLGYTAGRLRAKAASIRRKPRDLTVDAIVAATAMSLRPPVVVITSDSGDLELLLDGTGIRVYQID